MTAPLRLAVAATVMACGVHSEPADARSTASASTWLAHAPEAATRSGLSVNAIMRVMVAESRGRSSAVSPKGAIGCMQIMPSTWAYLSQRYGLGADPYDARMNMIGGALYLAELAHRFGYPGAYAAYNAGPARYIRYAANGVPLPAETVAYAARLGGAAAPPIAAIPRARWQEARLFLDRKRDAGETGGVEALRPSAAPDGVDASPVSPSASLDARIGPTLFPLAVNATLTPR